MPPKTKTSKFMQRCVADVAGQGKETGAAFAICTAQSQKAGYSKAGSRELTGKGKKRDKQFGRKKDMGAKRAEYLAATGRAEEAAEGGERAKKASRELVRDLVKYKGRFKSRWEGEPAPGDQEFADMVREYAWRGARWTDAEILKEPEQAAGYVLDIMRERERYAESREGRSVRGILARLEEAVSDAKLVRELQDLLDDPEVRVPGDLDGAKVLSATHGKQRGPGKRLGPGMHASAEFVNALVRDADGRKRSVDLVIHDDSEEIGVSYVDEAVAGSEEHLAEEDEDIPDVKAIAHEILRQLGGRRFLTMTGARDLIHAPTLDAERRWPTLSMKLPQGKAKFVKIALAPSDTYTVQFLTRSGRVIKELDDIYAEQLQDVVSRETGLALSL